MILGEIEGFDVVMGIGIVGICVVMAVALSRGTKEDACRFLFGKGKKDKSDKPTTLEKCANCGRNIGNLEKHYVFKDQIVCVECHQRLKNQE